MSAEISNLCGRLMSAMMNGMYQGILVALLVGIILRLITRTNAATRHAVWFCVLLFVAALVPAHFLLSSLAQRQSLAPSIAVANLREQSSETMFDSSSTSHGRANQPLPKNAGNDEPEQTELNRTGNFAQGVPLQEFSSPELNSKPGVSSLARVNVLPTHSITTTKPPSTHFATSISLPGFICPGVILAWALIAIIRAALILRQLVEMRTSKTASSLPCPRVQDLFDRIRGSLGEKRSVRLGVSESHRSAALLGFVRPMILIPAEMDGDKEESEIEHVLRHELAHLRRRDDWANLMQSLIQAVFCFHPAVWWICSRLSLEREIACDDCVLQADERPHDYALTLANLAARMNGHSLLLAPGVTNNKSQLQQRITMILNTKRDRSPRLARFCLGFTTTATAALAIIAIIAGPRLMLAQSPSVDPVAPTPELPSVSPSPSALIASTTPAVPPPGWTGNDSGPKSKSVSGDEDPTATISSSDGPQALAADPVAPLPPTPSVPAVAPDPPGPEVQGVPGEMKRQRSVEERLDRIERILEKLQTLSATKTFNRNGNGSSFFRGGSAFANPPAKPSSSGGGSGWSGGGGGGGISWSEAGRNFQVQSDAFQSQAGDLRNAEQSLRAMEEGQRAMEAGQRAAEKAVRDLEKMKNKASEDSQEEIRNSETEGRLKALQALRGAQDSLQIQIKSIEDQIQRLQEELGRLKDPLKAKGADKEAAEEDSERAK